MVSSFDRSTALPGSLRPHVDVPLEIISPTMEPTAFIILFIILAIVIRLAAGAFDGDRVEQYVREKGWELIDKSWDPFGPGWFGEQDSRIYEIVYKDREGSVHRAHVKTSMMSGVYLTNDRIVEEAPKPLLAEEKAALQKRLAELERKEAQASRRTEGNG